MLASTATTPSVLDAFSTLLGPSRSSLIASQLRKSIKSNPEELDALLRAEFGEDHSDIKFVMPYDDRWLHRFICRSYCEYCLVRTNALPAPLDFPTWEIPIEELRCGLIEGGWEVVSKPENFDVVGYAHPASTYSGEMEFGHWGMWFDGMVTSKNLFENPYRHSLNFWAAEAVRVVFLRHPRMGDPRMRQVRSTVEGVFSFSEGATVWETS